MPRHELEPTLKDIARHYKELLARLETPNLADAEVQHLKEQARDALRAGDFDRAEELLNQAKARDLSAIERMEADHDGRKLSAAAEAAAENGALMMTQFRYADAARYYAEAVGLTPEKYAEQLSARLTDWVEAAWRAGDYPSALDAARRALALEARLPADDARLGSRLNNLAELYWATGRYGEAEPLFRRAIAIGEKTLSPEHPDLATGLNNLAALYWATGRYAEAEPLVERALAIREKALGPEHPDVAAALNNLASLYRDSGRWAEAEPLYERALTIWGKSLPPDHPRLVIGLENYADLLDRLGRGGEATALRARAETIQQQREQGRQPPPSPPSP